MTSCAQIVRTVLLLALLGGAAAWRPVLQLGSSWPAWKLMLDDAASHTKANVKQSAQQDYTPDAKKDRVDSLPGFGDNGRLPFGLYAGCASANAADLIWWIDQS